MKKQQLTSFYLEALLLVVVFVAMILVLTGVFGAARAQSVRARSLTNAVTLSANAAEAVAAADDLEQLAALLEEDGNTSVSDGFCRACYLADGAPCSAAEAALCVEISWEPSADDPALVTSRIRVVDGEGTELYALETARFVKEAAA